MCFIYKEEQTRRKIQLLIFPLSLFSLNETIAKCWLFIESNMSCHAHLWTRFSYEDKG